MLETPTFIDDIISRIIMLLRKLFTHEQRLMFRTSASRLSQLSIQGRINFKWYNDLLRKQPDIVFVGF